MTVEWESFNGKLRDELLNRESFEALTEAKVLIGRRLEHNNLIRPHLCLRYRVPATEGIIAGHFGATIGTVLRQGADMPELPYAAD